jgi:hypothetical protein
MNPCHKGFNHASATLAFAQAKMIADWETDVMELPRGVPFKGCKSSPQDPAIQQSNDSALPPADLPSADKTTCSTALVFEDPDAVPSHGQLLHIANTMDEKLWASNCGGHQLTASDDSMSFPLIECYGGKGHFCGARGHVCGGKGHVFPLADLPPGPVNEGQGAGSRPVEHADEWEHVKSAGSRPVEHADEWERVKAVISDAPSMEEVSGEEFECRHWKGGSWHDLGI